MPWKNITDIFQSNSYLWQALKGHREHDHVRTLLFHLKVNSNYMLFFTKACVRLCNNLRIIRRTSVKLLGDLNYFHLCFNCLSWRKDKQYLIIRFGLIMCSVFPRVFFLKYFPLVLLNPVFVLQG